MIMGGRTMLKKLLCATRGLPGLTAPALADTTLKLVEVITSPERTETLKGIVADFEKANPGTHVEITSLPWGQAFEKFATMVSAGDTPDVVEMPDRWLSLYAGSRRLENLEPYLAKWDNTAGLNERALRDGPLRTTRPPTCCPTASICGPCSTTRPCSSRPASPSRPRPRTSSRPTPRRSRRCPASPAIACAAARAASTAG